jgi:hypothetical protein
MSVSDDRSRVTDLKVLSTIGGVQQNAIVSSRMSYDEGK